MPWSVSWNEEVHLLCVSPALSSLEKNQDQGPRVNEPRKPEDQPGLSALGPQLL